ncbi:MAG: A/G-specific adenine glycosylase [Bacteroidetes bacterium]|nr:MAG: A/G-specific adenine glycosylase [Bacteroidota bacterium]
MTDFSLLIRNWYRLNGRNLPWRETNDPYRIWLSEIILQQTRVDQGKSYYEKFVNNYPDVTSLAEASEQQVLNDWQGLGYYSRARNLQTAARTIVSEYNGVFPERYAELLKLKGIGTYSAAAISSFAFNEVRAVVDGNVYRVLSRYFNVSIPIDSTEGKKVFQALADELISQESPGEHNQAIMELGALICTPKNPDCVGCPVRTSCEGLRLKTHLNLPVKEKKQKVIKRHFHYAVYRGDDTLVLKKRTGKDIWQGLFEFPLIETKTSDTPDELINADSISKEYKHVLSHQHIHSRFYIFNSLPERIDDDWRIITAEELNDTPIPRLIDKFLSDLN